MEQYFSGDKLYGEDLSAAEREQWYNDEQEGYAELVENYGHAYKYLYHALNFEHGFRHLSQPTFQRVLGIGSAFGYEFDPILERCGEIVILDPSEGLTNPKFRYVRPHISGIMPFETSSFDLVTCLCTLHHVPKVSTYLKEIARVLVPGGFALVSDPIISMGDWRAPRPGLTKHERGIPLALFRSMLKESGLLIYREHLLHFPLTARLRSVLTAAPYNTKWVVKLDSAICSLPIWFRLYHARHWWQKFRATAAFFIVRKPA
ncbi:MAG: class I SAM-dependent methyltransferase [Terriglobales bacterium]|jgi:SAM-dependent methyltransferase